jgi:hypothetical protein
LQPHQTGLKVRCRSAVASAPRATREWLIIWAIGYLLLVIGYCAEGAGTRGRIELPLLPSVSQERTFAIANCKCTCTSDAHDVVSLLLDYTSRKSGALTRSCTGLTPIPKECIAKNALRARELVGARRLARPRLPDSESGGSAIPREPRAEN